MATLKQKVGLLAQVPLFAACSPAELNHVAYLADERHVTNGEVLIREGEVGGDFFLVVEGTARVTKHGEELRELGPGAFFGELALLDLGPRTATVTAVTDMRLLTIAPRGLASMLMEHPTVALKMLRTLSERLRSVEDRLT